MSDVQKLTLRVMRRRLSSQDGRTAEQRRRTSSAASHNRNISVAGIDASRASLPLQHEYARANPTAREQYKVEHEHREQARQQITRGVKENNRSAGAGAVASVGTSGGASVIAATI